jgi:putative DNA primase/helicase
MSDFISFARAHGVEIDHSKLFPSDRIKRCGTVDKPRSGNGAYFWDGQRGWVMDWSGEAKVVWYEDPNAKPWTEEEKAAFVARRSAQMSEQEKKYQETAQKADSIVKRAKLDVHPYLEMKGFPDQKGLVLEDRLIIPMRNVVTNKLQGLQEIWWNATDRKYEKKMIYGMRAKNAVLFMGNRDAGEIWLVEGFATGLSLRHAMRSVGLAGSVVVTFSASNMIQVADQIPGKKFVFADNDESMTGEKAAQQTGLPWTMADQVGWDANDLHKNKGLFAVVKKIMDLRVRSSIYS